MSGEGGAETQDKRRRRGKILARFTRAGTISCQAG